MIWWLLFAFRRYAGQAYTAQSGSNQGDWELVVIVSCDNLMLLFYRCLIAYLYSNVVGMSSSLLCLCVPSPGPRKNIDWRLLVESVWLKLQNQDPFFLEGFDEFFIVDSF